MVTQGECYVCDRDTAVHVRNGVKVCALCERAELPPPEDATQPSPPPVDPPRAVPAVLWSPPRRR